MFLGKGQLVGRLGGGLLRRGRNCGQEQRYLIYPTRQQPQEMNSQVAMYHEVCRTLQTKQ